MGDIWRVDDALEDCEYAGIVVQYDVTYEVVIRNLRRWLEENR